jgi:ankyrin repeat protein
MKFLKFAVLAGALLATAQPAFGQYASAGDEFLTAIRNRDGDKAEQLLKANPNVVNAKDDKGNTPLIIAILRSDEDYTAYLLNKDADPNLAAKSGDTPLIAASRVGFEQAVQWLIGQGAKVDGTNRMGETALIIAVQQRQIPIIRVLLSSGANPDKTDSASGRSARDYATQDTRSRQVLQMIEAKKPKAAAASSSR